MIDVEDKNAIWVDADACPVAIKEILYRAANRTQRSLTLVANQSLTIPRSPYIQLLVVKSGFDAADNRIIDSAHTGDLVVTQDLPLADELLKKGALVVTPRGELLTSENIKARLNMRDFLETMRSSGVQTGGPQKLSPSDVKAFADQLDRWLSRSVKPL